MGRVGKMSKKGRRANDKHGGNNSNNNQGRKRQKHSAPVTGIDQKLQKNQDVWNRHVEYTPSTKSQGQRQPVGPNVVVLGKDRKGDGNQSGNGTLKLTDADGFVFPTRSLFRKESLATKWPSARPIGAGLDNLGNTCFMNSVLQCLTYTPPLCTYLLSGAHERNCSVNGFCLLCELSRHVKRSIAATRKSIKPATFAHSLRRIGKSLKLGRQEDSHEFLRYMIDGLQNAALASFPGESPRNKETSVIHGVFGGHLRSQITCNSCNHKSTTFDPFLDLSLEIGSCQTLEKALKHFSKIEILDAHNKFLCEGCKKKVRASKQFTIHNEPTVLTIQLKRFGFSSYGAKINKPVMFPETLDIAPYTSKKKKCLYDLHGVLVHDGFTVHSGHYYCYVKNSNNLWYMMNDSQVNTVSKNSVLNKKAYMLFYTKKTAPTPFKIAYTISSAPTKKEADKADASAAPGKDKLGKKVAENEEKDIKDKKDKKEKKKQEQIPGKIPDDAKEPLRNGAAPQLLQEFQPTTADASSDSDSEPDATAYLENTAEIIAVPSDGWISRYCYKDITARDLSLETKRAEALGWTVEDRDGERNILEISLSQLTEDDGEEAEETDDSDEDFVVGSDDGSSSDNEESSSAEEESLEIPEEEDSSEESDSEDDSGDDSLNTSIAKIALGAREAVLKEDDSETSDEGSDSSASSGQVLGKQGTDVSRNRKWRTPQKKVETVDWDRNVNGKRSTNTWDGTRRDKRIKQSVTEDKVLTWGNTPSKLLEAERKKRGNDAFTEEREEWDEEYDKGKLKKIPANKVVQKDLSKSIQDIYQKKTQAKNDDRHSESLKMGSKKYSSAGYGGRKPKSKKKNQRR